jgi:predicted LPLAT superfamily acyltransferase
MRVLKLAGWAVRAVVTLPIMGVLWIAAKALRRASRACGG